MIKPLPSLFVPLPGNASVRRFFWLDGLRGVAAFSVLFWHYQHFFSVRDGKPPANYSALEPWHAPFALFYDYGFLAVPLFWLLSGFVFAAVYGPGRSTTRSFIVNRFARLYPLHLLTLLLVAGLQILAARHLGAPLFYENNDLTHFLLQLGMASAWRHWDQSFNGPIWSVSIEVLVYAIFWILHRRLFRFGVALPLLIATIFGFLRWAGGSHLILGCGELFFAGCALFVVHRAVAGHFAHAPAALGLLVAGGLLWCLDYAPLVAGMPLCFAGLVLIVSTLDSDGMPRPKRLLSFAGDSSYSMYLWHVPLQITVVLLAPSISWVEQKAQSPLWLIVYLLMSLTVARLSYLLIEKPLRDGIRRFGEVRQADPPIAAP